MSGIEPEGDHTSGDDAADMTRTTMSNTAPTREARRTARLANPDRLRFGTMLAWSGAGLSGGANAITLGFLSLYATDTLALPPGTVGLIILVSNIINGFSGVVGAWIVDRSPETRWGKARPYELAVVGTWVATWFLFATPTSLDQAGRTIWLAVWFVAINAVFQTLLNCNDTLYMARAFPNRNVYAKVAAQSGLITAIGVAVIFITMPMMLQRSGKDPAMWATTIGIYSVILGILGLSRGLWVKEEYKTETTTEQVRFRDMWTMVTSNPWIWAIGLYTLVGSIAGGAGVGNYYFRYIVGDLGLAGVLGFGNFLIMPLLLLLPWLMRKLSISRLLMYAQVFTIVGAAIYAVAGANVPLLVVGGLLVGLSAAPWAFLQVIVILDLATFNESKGQRRLESTLGALNGIFGRIGAGLGGAIVGGVLQLANYDGTLDKQAAPAQTAIWGLFALLPLAIGVVNLIVLVIYSRFDRLVMPPITAKIEALRKARHDHPESAAIDLDQSGRIEPDEIVPPAIAIPTSLGTVQNVEPELGLGQVPSPSDPKER